MVGGLSWGYVGLSWGQCGPILGLCWPILGLCWPILGAMLAHLGAMFALPDAYVGPCWPILSHKLRKRRKNAKSTKPCKTRDILALPGGSAAGGAAPLSYGKERTAVRQCHGQGAPGRIYEAYAWQPGAGKSRPGSPSWCCCCRGCCCCCRCRCRCCCCRCCCCCRSGCCGCCCCWWCCCCCCCCCCCWCWCCCCWPMLALFGRRFAPVLARGCCCCCGCCCRCRPCFLLLLLLADVGPIWAQFCPCLGPRLAHVAHILA